MSEDLNIAIDETLVFLSALANHMDERDEWEGRDLFRDWREQAAPMLEKLHAAWTLRPPPASPTGRQLGPGKRDELPPIVSEGVGGHTPGPWEWREDGDSILTMRTLSPGILVLDNDLGCGGPWGDKLDRANARLIAAAPDLLEACREAEEQLSILARHADTNWWVQRLRSALSKATGEGG